MAARNVPLGVLLLMSLTVAGWSQSGSPTGFPGKLPATFQGVIPCADCPGIDMELLLLPEGAYVARQVYKERSSAPLLHRGRWT
jgi:hypothetical protein